MVIKIMGGGEIELKNNKQKTDENRVREKCIVIIWGIVKNTAMAIKMEIKNEKKNNKQKSSGKIEKGRQQHRVKRQ